MSMDSNVVEYRGFVYNLLDQQFFLSNTSATTSTSAQFVSVIVMTVFPTVSSATEDQMDIAEGLHALQEPDGETWEQLKRRLGL